MSLPTDFMTTASILTFGGATAAVWIVTSVLGIFIPPAVDQKYRIRILFSLAFSLILAFIISSMGTDHSALVWLVALVNGCLIFLTTVGINTTGSKLQPDTRKTVLANIMKANPPKRGKFLDPWW